MRYCRHLLININSYARFCSADYPFGAIGLDVRSACLPAGRESGRYTERTGGRINRGQVYFLLNLQNAFSLSQDVNSAPIYTIFTQGIMQYQNWILNMHEIRGGFSRRSLKFFGIYEMPLSQEGGG